MTIALIGHVTAPSTTSNSVTSGSLNTTGADLLVFAVVDSDQTSVPSDSKGNTWVTAAGPTVASSPYPDTQLYYVKNPAVGTGHTFTLTATGVYPNLFVCAFSGTDLPAPLDQSGFANAFGAATLQPGSKTPTANGEVVVTCFCRDVGASPGSIDGGFTISDQHVGSPGAAWGGGMAYLIQTTAAAANPTWTDTSMFGACIATFKAAAAGSSPRSSWIRSAARTRAATR